MMWTHPALPTSLHQSLLSLKPHGLLLSCPWAHGQSLGPVDWGGEPQGSPGHFDAQSQPREEAVDLLAPWGCRMGQAGFSSRSQF